MTSRLSTATFWHRHPRDFANECDLVRATSQADRENLDAMGYNPLTKRAALAHIKWIKGENDAWGSNRAFGAMNLIAVPTLAEFLTS